MTNGNAQTEERRRRIHALVEDVLNGQNWDTASKYFAPEVVVHHPTSPEPITGVDAFESLVQTAYTGFPDWHFGLETIVVEGEYAAGRATTTGTHTGDFVGFPPTGERFEVTELVLFRFDGELVREAWIMPDLTRQMQQLGLIPEGPPPKPMLILMRLMQRRKKRRRE
jgi:steroid delta-isomerase-like uncharacterized protein